MSERIVISKVSELKIYDKILAGALLGQVTAADNLTVKSAVPADRDKYAVTFFNFGTIFLHRNTLVEIIPAPGSEEPDAGDSDDE